MSATTISTEPTKPAIAQITDTSKTLPSPLCSLCEAECPSVARNKYRRRNLCTPIKNGESRVWAVLSHLLGRQVPADYSKYVCFECYGIILKYYYRHIGLRQMATKLRNRLSHTSFVGQFKPEAQKKRELSPDGTPLQMPKRPCVPSTPMHQQENVAAESPLTSLVSAATTVEPEPVSASSSTSTKRKKRGETGFLVEACKWLANRRYSTAIKTLMTSSDGVRTIIVKVIAQLARQEMLLFQKSRETTLLNAEVNGETAKSFSWQEAMDEFETHLPILHSILSYTMTTGTALHKAQIEGNKIGYLVPGLVIVMAMVSKMRTPRFGFIPGLVGMSLIRSGCTSALLDGLSRTGFCHTAKTARLILKRYGKTYDRDILLGKAALDALKVNSKEENSDEENSEEENSEEEKSEEENSEEEEDIT